jgi:hypothetical protein
VDLVVGLDVGGTKLAVRAETVDGSQVTDVTVAASGWSATPAASAALWIAGHLARCLPAGLPSGSRGSSTTSRRWRTGPRAPAVFAAAEAGSGLAAAVIEAAAAELAGLVRRLRARGAVGTAVVAGGSVVTRQPLLARALAAQLRLVDAELELRVLAEEPVAGAVVLARRLLLGSSLTR